MQSEVTRFTVIYKIVLILYSNQGNCLYLYNPIFTRIVIYCLANQLLMLVSDVIVFRKWLQKLYLHKNWWFLKNIFFKRFQYSFSYHKFRNILRFVIKRNNVCKKKIVYQNTKFEEHVFVATNMSVLIHSKTTPITES